MTLDNDNDPATSLSFVVDAWTLMKHSVSPSKHLMIAGRQGPDMLPTIVDIDINQFKIISAQEILSIGQVEKYGAYKFSWIHSSVDVDSHRYEILMH